MLPLISFETGRKTPTQSSVQDHSLVCDSKWKSGSIRNRNHGREANTRGEEPEKNLHPRSSQARQESSCPLDKDLSWKSGSIRNRNHGREANTRGEEPEKNLHPRSSQARQESSCPLDKDLSWKSRNRKLTHYRRALCCAPQHTCVINYNFRLHDLFRQRSHGDPFGFHLHTGASDSAVCPRQTQRPQARLHQRLLRSPAS